MSRSRAVGTRWESAIVTYLHSVGWPNAERRTLNGAADKGDIAGVGAGAICIEAKAAKTITLATWLDEAHRERDNARAHIAAVWIKRRGRGSPADGYVVLDGETFATLLAEAGYQ